MKRFHLFEFEDFSWFPAIIRDGGTDFLGFVLQQIGYYGPSAKLIEDLVTKTGHRRIMDLCSGNGAPIASLQQSLNKDLGISYTLSDKYPNLKAYQALKEKTNEIVDYDYKSLDVLKDPIPKPAIRTMFTAAHHFKEPEMTAILSKAVTDGMPIALFDGGDKHLGSILAIMITHPLLFLFGTPFIKPFKWSRLLFTYILPLIPLYAIWDGIVSILRLHGPEDLLKMAQEADVGNKYNWQSGKIKNKVGFNMAYLIGMPK